MLKSAAVSLETIKLQLLENKNFTGTKENEFQLSKEAIKYLIKALEYADASFTQEIETVLTKSGEIAISALIKGLSSQNVNVKSTCAMVLIRLGEASVEPVKQFYLRTLGKPQLAWVAEFILDELGETYPRIQRFTMDDTFVDLPVTDARPLELEKVG
jgi:HEAT repeat protein